MTASNRPRTPVTRKPIPRRPTCLPARRQRGDERVLVEPPTVDGLAVTVRLIPLADGESNPLRARQLAVIVDLLRRARTEAEQEKAAKRRRRKGS